MAKRWKLHNPGPAWKAPVTGRAAAWFNGQEKSAISAAPLFRRRFFLWIPLGNPAPIAEQMIRMMQMV